jgi:hypothetical protein
MDSTSKTSYASHDTIGCLGFALKGKLLGFASDKNSYPRSIRFKSLIGIIENHHVAAFFGHLPTGRSLAVTARFKGEPDDNFSALLPA